MDSFTERMLQRAQARQKKIEEHYIDTNETSKLPLQDSNIIFQKYETKNSKSEPSLSECEKLTSNQKFTSDSCLAKLNKPACKENQSDSNLSKKGYVRVSSDLQSSPQTPTKTLNIQRDDFNMEIKLTSDDNVRVEVEVQERTDDEDDSDDDDDDAIVSGGQPEKTVIRANVKNRLQRLGQLYSAEEELSSPIQRTEATFGEDDTERTNKEPVVSGIRRLKALATTMNMWEDEISTPKPKTAKDTPKKSWKPPAPKPPVSTTTPPKKTYNKGPAPRPPTSTSTKVTAIISTSPDRSPSPRKSPVKDLSTKKNDTKTVELDTAVLATLESQGFTRTNSNTRLIYKYPDADKKTKSSGDQINEEESDSEDSSPMHTPILKVFLSPRKIAARNSDDHSETESIREPSPEPKIQKILNKFTKQQKDGKSTPRSPTRVIRGGDVTSKAALFDVSRKDVSNKAALFEKQTKDPALLSVSERKALFEKNKGTALVPKAAFGMAAPIKNKEEVKKTPDKSNRSISPSKVPIPDSPKKFRPISQSEPTSKATSPTKSYIAESGGIASKMKALLEKKNTTISQSQITNSINEQKKKDLDMLLNRFNKNKNEEDEIEVEENESSDDESVGETTKMLPDRAVKIVQFKEKNKVPSPPPPPPIPGTKSHAPKRRSKGDSPKVREVLEDVKRIKVSPPKSGQLYPCLSDIEASTETELESATATPSPDSSIEDNSYYDDSEEPDTSFGREILEVVCKNQTPQKRQILDDSNTSNLSDILDGMDDYLDEAMAADSSDYNEGPTPPKLGRTTPPRNMAAPSFSFNYSNGSPSKYSSPKKVTSPKPSSNSTAVYASKKSMDLPTHVVDGENIMPLTHTVSFYRKQQAEGSRTPMRQISRQAALPEESPEKETKNESIEVTEKIQELMNTVSKQQTVISQASQALNLCCSTIEFSGSSEQVEAERLLLVATQGRQAALNELQRLKVEGTLHPGGGDCVDKGTLVISDITLPLKKDYVRALSAAGGKGHHIVCLIRYAEFVLPTRLVSTVASPRDAPEMNLKVPGSVKLDNIFADFKVTIEVYSLQAQEELLPHDVKYHITTKKGGSKSTPKKLKHESKLVRPSVQSPAGPQAVRSPSFNLVGFAVFSLKDINRKQWTLNNAPKMSPLDGIVQMHVSCELATSIEHRGFLTMFDDISGFGAWHRRWCRLKGPNLSYWKYPDDERKKAPIDSINLRVITTKKVGQVSREICARPHTFLLETERNARPSDKDSLVTVCRGEKTIIRHLLSADTKEERNEWCEKFSKALESIRLWGRNSK